MVLTATTLALSFQIYDLFQVAFHEERHPSPASNIICVSCRAGMMRVICLVTFKVLYMCEGLRLDARKTVSSRRDDPVRMKLVSMQHIS
jgi:hypothetical protein